MLWIVFIFVMLVVIIFAASNAAEEEIKELLEREGILHIKMSPCIISRSPNPFEWGNGWYNFDWHGTKDGVPVKGFANYGSLIPHGNFWYE